MKTYKTKLDGVLMIEIDIFEDERGFFMKVIKSKGILLLV